MPQFSDPMTPPELSPLLQAVVTLMDSPAAIVANGEEVLAYNRRWRRSTRCANANESDKRLTLENCLKDYSQVDTLAAKLKSRSKGFCMAIRCHAAGESAMAELRNEYEVRWRQIQIMSQQHSLAIVTLQAISDIKSLTPSTELQQARIDRLLVHQTLIEESERRQLGRALHDVVVQDLAQVRSAVRTSGLTAADSANIITILDRIIEEVRTLTFDLGPPILDDLGLIPALQWLAEHLSNRYSANITSVDDGSDPRLSNRTQKIIFRAIRELAINAAKHASDSEIVISCVTNDRTVRIIVRDTGPGFNTARIHDGNTDIMHFGLLSVEQQIRGIGGFFDIVSEIGDGTRATIMIPVEPEKDTQHE